MRKTAVEAAAAHLPGLRVDVVGLFDLDTYQPFDEQSDDPGCPEDHPPRL